MCEIQAYTIHICICGALLIQNNSSGTEYEAKSTWPARPRRFLTYVLICSLYYEVSRRVPGKGCTTHVQAILLREHMYRPCNYKNRAFLVLINSGVVGSTEGCRESRRCLRDTYPESYFTRYTSIRRKKSPGTEDLR